MPIGSSCSRTWLISVVFPAPEGPETMKRVPSGWKLLDILHLFADPSDAGLLRDLVHAVAERRQQLVADVLAQRADALLQLADRLQSRADVGAQRLPFPRAHAPQVRERLAHEERERVALLVGDVGVDGV